MEQIFKSTLLLSCVGGALTAILLLLKPLTRRAFGVRWQCAVWLCVLAVMVIPVRFSLPVRVNSAQATAQSAPIPQNIPAAPSAETPPSIQPSEAPAPPALFQNFPAFLPILWLLGAMLSLVYAIFQYFRFIRVTFHNSHPIELPDISAVAAGMNIRRKIRVRAADCIVSPLTVGLFRTTLLLPADALQTRGLHDILLHELTHVKRCDIARKWFSLLVRCVHWFNPLVYFACRKLDETCEISCDLAVTKKMNDGEKQGYMRTILSLASPKKALPLAAPMSSCKAQIERRFTMIKTAEKRSNLAAFVSTLTAIAFLSSCVFVGGLAANAAGIYQNEKSAITVYNGAEKLSFTNSPYIENYEVYLPLRETLNKFGITDIEWNNGIIDIELPISENYQSDASQASSRRIVVGEAAIWYGEQIERNGYVLRYAPIVKDGVTYATVQLFEMIASSGHMADFRVNLNQSTDPKDYYTEGEEVFIGTSAQQMAYNPVDSAGNARYVKRIVTNEKGEAMLVATVENQIPENIAALNATNSSSMLNYEGRSRTFYTNSRGENVYFSSGIFVYTRTGENDFTDIAYIPPALQINFAAYNYPAAN